MALELNLEYYISFKHQYLQFDVGANLSCEVEAEAALDANIPLGYICVSPIPGIYIALEPALDLNISGKINVSADIKSSLALNLTHLLPKSFS